MWALNNTLTLWSNLRVANLPPQTPGRQHALISEAATWTLFASFSTLYFGLRSPILGAINTATALATTAHSTITTSRLDRQATWLLAPRLAWLAHATYVSVGTAIHNRDALFNPDEEEQPQNP